MAQVDRIMRRVTSVHLAWRQIVTVVVWGTANWLLDCTCFAMMFLAVDSTIPWKGLLLAYGAGQLAAALPITPGGLGAVEGSITIALVAFGGDHVTTVDAVLMYRLISFWLVLVVGWSLWGELAHEVRRGRWNREVVLPDTGSEPSDGPPEGTCPWRSRSDRCPDHDAPGGGAAGRRRPGWWPDCSPARWPPAWSPAAPRCAATSGRRTAPATSPCRRPPGRSVPTPG